MRHSARAASAAILTLVPVPAWSQTASTEPEARFGKPITLTVGYAPGGSYDLYARFTGRFLGRHLPGKPSVVVQNMPGAGSLQAANYIYKVAPKDGTAIAVIAETIPMEQALQNPGVQYDAARFTYIGRLASSNNIHLVWHTAKAQTMQDVMTTQMTVAGTGPANIAETVPKLLNALAGTKFKVVSGYPSSGPAMVAMERGEVDGTGTSWAIVKAQRMSWINEGKARIMLQVLPSRSPELPDVPALGEYGSTPEDKAILNLYASGGALGRYIVAPPELAPEIARALRDGLQAMMKDPEFLAEAKKSTLDIEPSSHSDLEAVTRRTLQVSDAIRSKVREIFKQ
jgi:tripartite-type tricarboxylate transporter receptor subunit TctC